MESDDEIVREAGSDSDTDDDQYSCHIRTVSEREALEQDAAKEGTCADACIERRHIPSHNLTGITFYLLNDTYLNSRIGAPFREIPDQNDK